MIAEYRLRDLPDDQQRKLQSGASAEVAEELAARALGSSAKHRPDRAEWWDVIRETTGAKFEVKSTFDRIGEDYPADGRFRLRGDQHRSLTASAASGVAWYVFVLFDKSRGVAWIQKARPSTVTRWVNERGGWNEAGHDEFDEQHKLPAEVVFG